MGYWITGELRAQLEKAAALPPAPLSVEEYARFRGAMLQCLANDETFTTLPLDAGVSEMMARFSVTLADVQRARGP